MRLILVVLLSLVLSGCSSGGVHVCDACKKACMPNPVKLCGSTLATDTCECKVP